MVGELVYGGKYALLFHPKQIYTEGKLHGAESVPAKKERCSPFLSQAMELTYHPERDSGDSVKAGME